jgi:hypothetical protein
MTEEVNTSVVDGYFGLISTLSNANKHALIDKLQKSMLEKEKISKKRFEDSFGAFESELTAQEIIEDIRNSRSFTREIESFD